MYENDQGVVQDHVEAARWFRLAAKKGDAAAQFLLGRMYENGHGVEQDRFLAFVWYSIAAANEDAEGAGERDRIAQGMTRTQIAETATRARICIESGYVDCD